MPGLVGDAPAGGASILDRCWKRLTNAWCVVDDCSVARDAWVCRERSIDRLTGALIARNCVCIRCDHKDWEVSLGNRIHQISGHEKGPATQPASHR